MIRFRGAEGVTKHRTDRVWRLGMVSRTLWLGSAGLLVALALVGCSGNSAVASPTTSLAPTPSRAAAPSSTPTPTASSTATSAAPSKTPEVAANPDAHEQLMTSLQKFVNGKDEHGTPFVFPKGRFSESLNSPTTLPENTINTANTRIDLTLQAAADHVQGVLLGEEEVLNSKTNVKSLVAYVGFESGSTDANTKNFYVPINLGRIGIDTDELDNWGGVIWNSPTKTSQILPALEMEQRLQELNGQSILTGFAIYNGDMLTMLQQPDQPGEGRSRAEYLAQIDLSKSLVLWMEKTVNAPYQSVPMDSLIRNIVNHPVTDLKSLIPSTGNIVQYPLVIH